MTDLLLRKKIKIKEISKLTEVISDMLICVTHFTVNYDNSRSFMQD